MSETPLEITCRDVHTRIATGEPLAFIDCREADEYDTARIDGATLIPMSVMTERVAELEPHKQDLVVVHCHHGGRSLRVARWLRNQGFTHAVSMAGGIDEWAQVIDPRVPRY